MKQIAIVAIFVLAVVAVLIEEQDRNRRDIAAIVEPALAIDRYAQLTIKRISSDSVAAALSENQRQMNRMTDSLEQVALLACKCDDQTSEKLRREAESRFASDGAILHMVNGPGYCNIELRVPGMYSVHVWAHNGKAESTVTPE